MVKLRDRDGSSENWQGCGSEVETARPNRWQVTGAATCLPLLSHSQTSASLLLRLLIISCWNEVKHIWITVGWFTYSKFKQIHLVESYFCHNTCLYIILIQHSNTVTAVGRLCWKFPAPTPSHSCCASIHLANILCNLIWCAVCNELNLNESE